MFAYKICIVENQNST